MTDQQPATTISNGLKSILIFILIFMIGVIIGGITTGIIAYKYYTKETIAEWTGPVTPTIWKPGTKEKPTSESGDIWIEGKQNKLKFNVTAGDNFKSASRELKIAIPVRPCELGPWAAGLVGYDNVGKKLTAGYSLGGRFAYSWGFAALGIAPGYFTIGNIQGAIVSIDGTLRW